MVLFVYSSDEQAVSTSNEFERSADTASLSDHIRNVECSESLENTSTGTSSILEEEQVINEKVACVSSSNTCALFVDHPTCISMRKVSELHLMFQCGRATCLIYVFEKHVLLRRINMFLDKEQSLFHVGILSIHL